MPWVEHQAVSPSGRQSATAQCDSSEFVELRRGVVIRLHCHVGRFQSRLGVSSLVIARLSQEALSLDACVQVDQEVEHLVLRLEGDQSRGGRVRRVGGDGGHRGAGVHRLVGQHRFAVVLRGVAGADHAPHPGIARAASRSIDTSRALAWGLRNTRASSIPGRLTSEV